MRIPRLKTLIGGMATVFVMLCLTPAAFAQADPCAGPFPNSGNDVYINKSGSCNITTAINVSGNVYIVATGSVKTTNTVTAGGDVYMDGATGTSATMAITAGSYVDLRSDSGLVNITGSITASGGTTYLQGQTGVKAAAVTASDHVDIRALAGDITLSKLVTSTNNYIYLQGQNISSTSTTDSLKAGYYIQATDANIKTINLKGTVTASDHIDMRAFSGDITFGKLVTATNSYIFLLGQDIISNSTSDSLNAGSYIQVTDSTIQSINLKGTVKSGTANMGQGGTTYLWAQGNIASGPITDVATNAAAMQQGYIDIRANLGGSSSPFIIGGSGNLNGINTTGTAPVLVTDTNAGGGVDQTYSHGGVYVKNLAGGITVIAPNNISVKANSSKAGSIILDARSDTLTLPSGTISADGGTNQDAGFITLFAKTINAASDTVLSASQSTSAPLSAHGVLIAAGTVNYGGSTNGLTIHADGGGANSANTAYVTLIPTGAASIHEPNPNDGTCYCLTLNGNLDAYVGAISYAAANGSKLNVTANGSNSAVNFSGYPMSITGGNVTFQSQGSTNHLVYVGFYQNGTGSASLTFGNNGATLLDASVGSSAGTGGNVTLNAYTATITSPTMFTMNANGPTGANGDGGQIFYSTGSGAGASTFGANLKGLLTANGSGIGNASPSAITFYPGNTPVKLGANKAGDFQFLANGGATSGNGGTIIINPSANNGNLTIDTANAISASVPGSSGTGGTVTLIANPTFSVTSNLTGASINVDGKGSGNGGNITIEAGAGDLTLGNTAGGLSLSAQNANGTGNGGNITIEFLASLTIDASLNVNAGNGSGSNGKGGSILVDYVGTLTVGSSTINASGQGNGQGGNVTLNADNPIDLSQALINASAGTVSTGTGIGGVFAAMPVLQQFDVNGGINVDGGPKVGITGFDGSIKLNAVTCQQWQLTQMTWPKSYWDCVNPGSPSSPGAPTTLDKQPSILATGTAFISSVRSEFAAPPSRIYVFTTPANYNSFFNETAPLNSIGFTASMGTTSTIYSSIFDYNFASTQTGYNNAQETTAHELGHAIDQIKQTESVTSDYLSYAAVDFLYLDYITVGTSPQTSTPRDPCSGSGAPYASLNDESTGLVFCVSSATSGYTLVPGSTKYIESQYVSGGVVKRNSQIAQVASSSFGYTTTGGWVELYAQSFAYAAFVHTIPNTDFNKYTTDGLMYENYFGCTRGWSTALLSDSVTPPSPALTIYGTGYPACSAAPGWYRTLLGH